MLHPDVVDKGGKQQSNNNFQASHGKVTTRSCMWPLPGESVLWQLPEEGPYGSIPENGAT